ncbi:MAG: GTPase domain-containing protein [Methylicorpusculum sp.]|uniref:GTPase domain-containing protein n=1 Tax=Methylicorpusculum sp. TaxID=2713644 RepID=UPI00271A1841|nr:GTPase domain-containing protein [Methylicorpusculum sp.]MDO8940125.1 GTPase domain-containing protein [Methylicorpusculum sp.]MDP2200725.1 GTPase domain-containing protein [Methylicorpusculum sp.]
MLEFIKLLKQRYQQVSAHDKSDNEKTFYQQKIDQLVLAEAFIRKTNFITSSSVIPANIAVIGPTQAGKSTLVNLLLGDNCAGVSPLAGYTVHAQGFCHQLASQDCTHLQHFFGHYEQVLPSQLSKDRYDCYSLSESQGESKLLSPCIIWDTPDFDSIDASGYSESLLRTIALADVLVLVVSKEKYADQSVWTMMRELEAFNQPTLIVVNKLPEGSEAIITASLKQKWHSARTDALPEIIPLFYQAQGKTPQWPAHTQSAVKEAIRLATRRKPAELAKQFLKVHWQDWLEPVIAEHEAYRQWASLVDELTDQALHHYQRDYLNHPHHYETFQHALASLLTLLEIPGLDKAIFKTRQILTWPIKKLGRLTQRRPPLTDSSHEVMLLNQLAEHILIQLADKLFDKAGQDQTRLWWKSANGLLRQHRKTMLAQFSQAVDHYHLNFQVEVDTAAQRLYTKLKEQPFVLNSLRATRATTDAAAIALSLQFGGIGLHDLLIAPAMFSVTSLLAESAIGSYVNKVQAELKTKQLHTVKHTLFFDFLQKQLYALPEQINLDAHFNITPHQLEMAEQQLREKPHGLRLL